MSNAYLKNAFRMLDALNEDVFDISDEGISQLADTLNTEDNTVNIIDPEAESEEDIQDSYMGKAILECEVCHSLIYKGKDEIKIDDESQLANIDEECPYCFSTNGYKVVGQVAPFEEKSEEDDLEIEVDGEDVDVESEEDDESLGESLKEASDKKSKVKLRVTFYPYERYTSTSKKTATVSGSDLLEALSKMVDRMGLYITSEDIVGQNMTAEDVIDEIESSNGDGCDYIVSLVNVNTGEVLIEAWDEEDEEDWDDMDESLKEGFNDVQITTDDQHLTMTQDSETGKVTVETEPIQQEESFEDSDMMIAPLNDEDEQEIEDNSDQLEAEEEAENEEAPEEMEAEEDEESEDVDISDFEESLFNDLGQKYLTEVYNNIESFNTSKVYQDNKNNKLIIEGVIKFNSGNTKKTSFIFEAKDIDKDRKVRFVGENQQITKGKKSFTLRGTLKDGNLLSESLTYNYRTRDNDGESVRLYNTIKVGK